jgi:hypothetical protein
MRGRIGRGIEGFIVIVLIAVGASLLIGGPTLSGRAPNASGTVRPASPIPNFGHIYLLILENKGLDQILSTTKAPYLSSLIARYGLATNYNAVWQKSQPNYLALFSGSTHDVTDDQSHDFAGPNLADQIDASERTWAIFAENVPAGCYAGLTSSGGPDGQGTYARKHEPAISFTDISQTPGRCARITNFSHFDPTAADFELIVPNLCNDMHDCSIADGDAFLARFVPRILSSPAWQSRGILFITFDEGSGSGPHPDRVATLVVSPGVPAGFRSTVYHTHYSLLRTVQAAWDLGCLDRSCRANDLSEFFP